MKFLFSEYQADYAKYYFPYQVYALKEDQDKLEDIYNAGLLPSRIHPDLFYLARSLRIDLSRFKLSSENRRILRKTEYLKCENTSLKRFTYNYKIGKLGKDFYTKRFGEETMSAFQVKSLFTQGACTHVLTYKNQKQNSEAIGYCLTVQTSSLLHYAYPFYDLTYFKKNLGMGMMLQAIVQAKKLKLKYIYLGTCYTNNALYKLQFTGLEYFNGFKWSNDIDKLKESIQKPILGHIFEHIEDKKKMLEVIQAQSNS